MKRLLLILLLACALSFIAGFIHGQEPLVIDWPDVVEQGDLLELIAPDAESYDWAILPKDTPHLIYDRVVDEVFEGEGQVVHRNSIIVVSTKFEGELYISLAVYLDGSAVTVLHKITVGEIIEPSPNPIPFPTPQKIFAVMIEETGDRDDYSPKQIQALISKKDLDYMKSKGFQYRKVDQDVVEPDGQGGDRVPLEIASFLQRAENQELPRLIIANESGAVLHDAIVVDEDSNLEILQQYGGE